jgi:hypothetical protein
MKSLALETQGNTFIRENGRFRYTKDNLEYLAQKVRSVISIMLGEWFLDQTLGVPYMPQSDNKVEHRPLLETSVRTKITAVVGIKKIVSFVSELNNATRQFTVAIVAESDEGELIELTESFTGKPQGGTI